jgi:GntR family transcriptional regulator, transcriptional repressor for pyruvate dehydrogenase complex
MVRERVTPSAAEAIAQSLRRQIVDEFADGEHIGSAEDLMDRFQVSGPTLRQAMRVLEAEGLVKVRRGNSGGFFASTPSIDVVSRSASALLRRQGAQPADLIYMAQLIGPVSASPSTDALASSRISSSNFLRFMGRNESAITSLATVCSAASR